MTAAEYDDEFARDQTEMRLKLFHDRRPPVFAARGWLDTNLHAWLEGMVRGENRTLLVGGLTGVGKSWSLWKSVETLLSNGWRGRWEIINATEFRDIIAPPVDELRLLRLRECEFLALDDVGAWRISDWAAEQIYGIVDYRWSHELPVVISSNESDIAGLLGTRVTSRLSDGMAEVYLDGPDRRTL
jgi:DNA replication protein DnaC